MNRVFIFKNTELRTAALDAIKSALQEKSEIALCDEDLLTNHDDEEALQDKWNDLPYVDYFGKYNTFNGYRIWKVILEESGNIDFIGYTDDQESIENIWHFNDDDLTTMALCDIADQVVNTEVYYQPDMGPDETLEHELYSFDVFKDKSLAERLFPGFEIKEYRGYDIEDHRYIDDSYKPKNHE